MENQQIQTGKEIFHQLLDNLDITELLRETYLANSTEIIKGIEEIQGSTSLGHGERDFTRNDHQSLLRFLSDTSQITGLLVYNRPDNITIYWTDCKYGYKEPEITPTDTHKSLSFTQPNLLNTTLQSSHYQITEQKIMEQLLSSAKEGNSSHKLYFSEQDNCIPLSENNLTSLLLSNIGEKTGAKGATSQRECKSGIFHNTYFFSW